MLQSRNDWLTADMAAIEVEALRLLDTSLSAGVGAAVAAEWIAHVGAESAAHRCFESEFRQAAFVAALRAVNADTVHPRIYALGRVEHQVDSYTIPGTNYGHGNADCIYRLMPVAPGGTYRLSGTFAGKRPTATEISLIDRDQGFLGNLRSEEIVVDADGTFSVLLTPQSGRSGGNTLANVDGAYNLCVRDVHGDALTERMSTLAIERLDEVETTGWTERQAMAAFPDLLRAAVSEIWGFENRNLRDAPANTFTSPVARSGDMLLPSQAFAMGRFLLDADMAIVFRIELGGAGYFIMPATNAWGGLGDFLSHASAINMFHAEPDPNGQYTFVLSLADPGVANWIDPQAAAEGAIIARWLNLRPSDSRPGLVARVVRLAELPGALPPGIRYFNAGERAAQREAHRRNYAAMKQ